MRRPAELIALRPDLPIRILAHAGIWGKAVRSAPASVPRAPASSSRLTATVKRPGDIPKLLALFRREAANPSLAMGRG